MLGLDIHKIINVISGIKNPKEFKYFYSIIPTNFVILSEKKQNRKLVDFFELLRILEKDVMITLDRISITIPYKGKDTKMQVLQVYIDSYEPLDDVLEKLGFTFTIDEAHPKIKVENENLRSFSTIINNQPCYGRAYIAKRQSS